MEKSIVHDIENTIGAEFTYKLFDAAEECPTVHFHKNYEIIYAVKGICHLIVDDKQYILEEGKAAFIICFQPHSFTVEKGSVAMCVDFHEHLILTLSQIIEKKRADTPIFIPDKQGIDFVISQMEQMFGNDSGNVVRISPPSKRIRVKSYLYLLGSDALEKITWISAKRTDAVITDIIQYISENYRRDISLIDIASERGYNYQYLSRIFNKTLGLNFKKLLNQYRMECAFRLLQDTNLPLTQIAFESGFQSIRSFDQVCKNIYNKTPSELRTNQRSNTK